MKTLGIKYVLGTTILFCVSHALAWTGSFYTKTVNGVEWCYTLSDNQASIGVPSTSGMSAIETSTAGSIVIPASLDDCPVTAIGYNAFKGCSGLSSITIPNNVTSIGFRAFEGCSGLTSISIPNSVKSIGEYAFFGCSECLFETNIIPGIKLVDGWVVGYTDLVPEDIDLTNTRGILDHGFYNCTGLKAVAIPTTMSNIGEAVFYGCSGLTSISIPISVTSLGDNAFSQCSGLTSIAIPGCVTSIGRAAFSDCSGLTSITIPDSITSVRDYTFYGCTGLMSITIPDSVITIGENAFSNCSNIGSAFVPGRFKMPEIIPSSLQALSNAVISAGVTKIADEIFASCEGLTSVTLPESLIRIGASAFSGCTGLVSISIPGNVIDIGNSAFSNCSGLMSIEIPNGVSSIGDNTFNGCSSLVSISIPDNMASIGKDAFHACSGLMSITIPDTVTTIGTAAFSGCSRLASINLPDGLTTIGSSEFAGCSNLTSVSFPKHLTKIEDSAFFGCSSLQTLVFPESVTSIGNGAFSGCVDLSSLIIPNSVTVIGNNAFANCAGLEWILLPRRFEKGIASLSVPSGCEVLYYDCIASFNVLSRHGHPIQAGEETPYVNWDSAMSCDVESILPDKQSSDIRYICTGWKGTGSVPATGTGTNCTFVLTEDSTLEWQWQTNVWISLAVDGEATSTFKHGWFANDATAVVPFDAPAGLLKCVVSGDADGVTVDQAARTISIPTDRPRAVSLHVESYCDSISTDGKFVDYTLSGEAPWEPVAETSGTDGQCLRSGLVASGEASVLETKVSGAGMLTFRWKASCNRGDYCKLVVDGAEVKSISRSASAWATVEHEIEGAGEHTVHWSWEKSASAPLGENGVFLDDVCWKPYVTLAVTSTDGTPDPATGTTRHLYGEAIVASVAEPAAANGTRRVCTGWSGTESVPDEGAGTSVSFSITNDSTLVWNWRTEHWIDVRVRGPAKTDFTACWLPAGTTATVEFVSTAPLAATALLGDTEGASLNGLTLSVPVDSPRTITVRATAPNLSLDVVSARGTALPEPGRHWNAWGTEVAASVSEPVPSNGVQYVCTGWTGTGDVPACGKGTNTTFTVTQASTLDWTWQTNVWLSLVCEGLVVADLDGEWIEKGTTRIVHYEPLAEFFTVALGGDADGVALNEETRTISIPADRPRGLSLDLTMHTLRTALDAEGFLWTTSNNAPWIPQVAVTSDDEDAAASGGIATGEESVLQTTVSGSGTLSWFWRLDADGVLGVDVEVDGEYATSLETPGAWESASVVIEGDGVHAVRFIFWNEDPDATTRTERAYLDRVAWTGASPMPAATKTMPEPVLHAWLAERAPTILSNAEGNYEAAASAKAANGRFVWECFVADVDPEDPDADFRADIVISNGIPVVTFEPDLGDERRYAIEGKETLDASWGPTNDLSRFFRAKVSLPPDWTPDGIVDGFPEMVTVSFDPNGGTVDPTALSFAHPDAGLLGELPVPSRGGALFSDWRSASGVPFAATSLLPWIDVTLFAGWNIAVAFNPNGGTGTMPTLTAPLGEPLALPENGFARIGHSFGGWASTSSGAVAYQPGDEVAFDSSRTLFATWGVNQYELAFDPAGGSAIVPQTNDYASAVVPPSAPTRDGFSFEGWDPPLPQTMPASNLVSTARWRLESHTLSFDSAGGSAVAPITQESGTELVAPPVPTRTGYDFVGWHGGMPATMPASDTTLVAQWTPHRYIVRFRHNGGTGGMLDLELTYGETIALPACQFTNGNPPFIGWSTSPDGAVVFADGAEVSNLTAEDNGFVELFAIWSPGTYTIHFDANGGAGTMSNQTFWIGVAQALVTNAFTKTNAFFIGWSTNGTEDVVFTDGESIVNLASAGETITLWAVWALYCIVDLSGGTSASSYPITHLAEPPTGGFNTDEYKTSKLVLRCLEPGPIPTLDATITKPFYVGLFEVTQRQWELVMGTRPSYFSNNSYYATRPVESVSYNMIRGTSLGAQWPASNGVDADSFLGKLRARTGLDFDLPTEAQWEYACRAGTTSSYNNGGNSEDDLKVLGRYGNNGGSGSSSSSSTANGTAAVGSYLPNAWGLYDMHGNVWEWCLDWWGRSLSGADPEGSSSGSSRVLRGGCWYLSAGSCTSSHRDYYGYPSRSYFSFGFRLVRTLSNE